MPTYPMDPPHTRPVRLGTGAVAAGVVLLGAASGVAAVLWPLPVLVLAAVAAVVIVSVGVRPADVARDLGAAAASSVRETKSPSTSVGRLRWWWVLLPVSALVALDGTNRFSTGSIRYLPVGMLLAGLGLLLVWQGRLSPVAPEVRWFSTLWVLGLAASLVAFRSGSENTWLQVFLPMSVAVVLPRFALAGDRRESLLVMSRVLAIGTTLMVVLSAVLWVAGAPQWSGLGALHHEMAFINATAVVMCWSLRLRLATVANLLALVVAFIAYPAATYPLVIVSTGAGLILFMPRAATVWRAATALALLAVVSLSVIVVTQNESVTGRYASAVDKYDNSQFRRELWSAAVADIQESPVTGSFFTGPYAMPVSRNSRGFHFVKRSVPVHNEYLSVLRGGGVIGLLLLVAPLVCALRRSLERLPRVDAAQARLIQGIAGSAIAFLVASMFNPVMARVPTAIFGWFIVGLLFLSAGPEATAEGTDGAGGAGNERPDPG